MSQSEYITHTGDAEYVYAIGHPDGYVKIGRSADPRKRVEQLQTSSPYKLWVVASLPVQNATEVESKLHDHFSENHVRGEWYAVKKDDYDEIINAAKEYDSGRYKLTDMIAGTTVAEILAWTNYE